jgi:energy-coupling factor transport system ATP-binding protein
VTDPVVVVDDLTFRYRRRSEPSLRSLSLAIEPGEVLLVAGPSGCGKSTLIRALNGLIPHAYRGELAGRVLIDGQETAGLALRDLARLVGTVLQDPRKQLVASTVEGELAFGPENLGIDRADIRRRLVAVAADAGIEPLLARTTDQLSGGEAQALAVAGALMLDPKLLVLDEPLANLDPANAHRLLGLVRKLASAGTAVVLVEHRIEDALDAGPDRVLYLEDGATRFLGPVPEFLAQVDPRRVKVPFSVWLDRARPANGPRPPARATSDWRTPRLEWQDVHAAYDDIPVLHGISSRIGRGERVALLGPNGSGKTTLFKTGIGLIRPTSGTVLVDGASIADRSVADLVTTFGYVFQNPSQMLFAATVREEILFGPRNLGRPEERFDALVRTALREVNLLTEPDIESRPPLTLSFGQQKRLAIAVALALEPRTLVLDEPSAGQDYRSAASFMTEVERIAGLESVYFVTHDADLALAHADRILLLRDGRLVADGPPMDVIADRDRWQACNLRFTSLMDANLRWPSPDGQFESADVLAARMVGASQSGKSGGIGPAH